jgi:threonine dehydratase
MIELVSIDAIRQAGDIVYRHLSPSPLLEYPLLGKETGVRIFTKHENHLPTGAFKVRGGIHFMKHFAEARTHSGIVTATRGNHGQSAALAGKIFDIPVTIVVPYGNNPEKNAAMVAFGARLIEHGRDFDEAREKVQEISDRENLRYLHSANEPHLINGVGTYALEILETAHERGERIDAIFVPIGMGSGVCGVITAFRTLSPQTRIYGVQAEGAPSHYLSWKAGKAVATPEARTFADGVATRVPAEMTLEIILRGVDEIVLVSDAEIAEAIRLLWRTTHNLVEGAGAIATAATVKMREQLQGKTVVNVLSGGNLDTETLQTVFRAG